MAWHHCRRSCRYSGVKGSTRKGPWNYDLLLQGIWKLFVEQFLRLRLLVSLNESLSTCACRTILRLSHLVVFLVATDPVFLAWVPSIVNYSEQFLTAHSERYT
ncbi:hypothetical protein TNCV_4588891 [Trichonephila clavipes]|nr:hypothetical protein TNCV_4588891 [Trichonephila clavipes]